MSFVFKGDWWETKVMESRYWLSVDVGIIHLGLVLLSVTEDWRVQRVEWHRLIDITKMRHNTVGWQECPLGHTATITDRMDHVYQEHADIFQRAEHICIEQQPITGLQAVQESLFKQFRDKVQLISPVKMHRYFGIHHLDYEQRKEQTVALARLYFVAASEGGRAVETAESELIQRFEAYRDKKDCDVFRLHDIADAICLAVFALAPLHRRHTLEAKRRRAGSELVDADGTVNLSRFRRSASSTRSLSPKRDQT